MGTDILCDFKGSSQDFEQATFSVIDHENNKHSVPIRFKNKSTSTPKQSFLVASLKTKTIPARCQPFVNSYIKTSKRHICDALFCPNQRFSSKGVLIGHTLMQTGKPIIPLLIANTSEHPVTIYEGTVLGVSHPVPRKNINFIHSKSGEIFKLGKPGGKSPQTTDPIYCTNRTKTTQKSDLVTPETQLNWEDKLSNYKFENDDLSKNQQEKLRKLLKSHETVFSKHDYDLGLCGAVKHRVNTAGSEAPIRLRPHRLPHHLREQLRKDLQEMQKHGIISESDSAWASPIVYVTKSDGTYRLCTDFRRLNEITEPDIYPLPRINDILDS